MTCMPKHELAREGHDKGTQSYTAHAQERGEGLQTLRGNMLAHA